MRKALEKRFDGLIDLADKSTASPEERHDAFLSRGLAALAIQIEHPCNEAEAARAVFDGSDDHGLDAVAVRMREEQPHIILVQAKWSHKGKAAFGETEVDRMLRGLDMILGCDFDSFNSRFQQHVRDIERALDRPLPKVTLVLALLRGEPLNSGVRKVLEQAIAKRNYGHEMVDYKVLDLRDFHQEILGKSAAPKINLTARVEGFSIENEPYKAVFGTMTVPDISNWYAEYGRALFVRNIRDSLDLTDVNVKIRNTLLEQPHHFWYFSNGVTLLCDTIKKTGKQSAVPGGVGEFHLEGASVVNGAQTVSAIHRAFSADAEKASRGRVMIRLISLEDCPPGFGDQVTTSTNTQNPIEDRDFKSMDKAQTQLRDDFALSLHLTYVIKRGEPLPDEDKGCSITEAAVALAATHPNAELAALAKRDKAALWDGEIYRALFGKNPEAYGVWHRVQLLREVRKRLAELREGLLSRAAATASYADLLITHVVYQQLDNQASGASGGWDLQLERAAELTETALGWVMSSIDAEYGPTSQVFAAVRNTERIQRVVQRAVRGMESGRPAPKLDAKYQVLGSEEKGRKVDAVRTLVRAGRIPDGTILEFRPVSRPERREMTAWLAEDPARSRAVWRNSIKDQLQWEADGKWYSPSGLVGKMRHDASGQNRSVQGTLHWHVPGEGSLVDLADAVRAEQGLDVGDETGES
ncbi:AIPR family protein [Microbispora bryophytorum]|uniref:AIPR family protein n=1 Tax=Microbispora bryophytorum TaxID=1460882 RepID=UPI0033F742A5